MNFSEMQAVFANMSAASLGRLHVNQMKHLVSLITDGLSEAHVEGSRRIGRAHHLWNVEPAWAAGAYSLYYRHLSKQIFRIKNRSVRTALRSAVVSLLLADLAIQLEGYAQARAHDDHEIRVLFDLLIESFNHAQSGEKPDALLRRLAQSLPKRTGHVVWAWYGLTDRRMSYEFIPADGMAQPPVDNRTWDLLIGECVDSLQNRRRKVLSHPDLGRLGIELPGVREIGIFPFEGMGRVYRGVGMAALNQPGYLSRFALGFFDSMARIGALVLTLRAQNLRDALTGLPNRTLYKDRLSVTRSRVDREQTKLIVGMIDLDLFKEINDGLGHSAGDLVLCETTKRIKSCLRAGDTLARMGGDEFAILVGDIRGDAALKSAELATRINQALCEPFNVDGMTVHLSASIGLSIYPDDYSDSDTLLHHADLAMYHAKQSGRSRYALFSAELARGIDERADRINMLRIAMRDELLVLHYQPIVDLESGRLVGVEALLRIMHPTQGVISAGPLLEIVEDDAVLIREIGRIVLGKACEQLAAWRAVGGDFYISVNIGARHIMHPAWAADLNEILGRHRALVRSRLVIEVTERAPLDVKTAFAAFEYTRNQGLRLALDDFGTGQASLHHLQRLPIDYVKIDRSFVSSITVDHRDRAIVGGVIGTCRMLGLACIAEGAETDDQLLVLSELGCFAAQGFRISRAVPAEAVFGIAGEWLEYWRQRYEYS